MYAGECLPSTNVGRERARTNGATDGARKREHTGRTKKDALCRERGLLDPALRNQPFDLSAVPGPPSDRATRRAVAAACDMFDCAGSQIEPLQRILSHHRALGGRAHCGILLLRRRGRGQRSPREKPSDQREGCSRCKTAAARVALPIPAALSRSSASSNSPTLATRRPPAAAPPERRGSRPRRRRRPTAAGSWQPPAAPRPPRPTPSRRA